MPGLTAPINSAQEDIQEHWSPTSYVQQMFNSGRDNVKLCGFPLEGNTTNQQFSVRLPIEGTMGEIVHKDWQYFVTDPNITDIPTYSHLGDQPETTWSITNQYIAGGNHQPGVQCVTPLQSPWNDKPSYVM